MLKVLIADDEQKIRHGLKNSLCWSDLGMEVAGEAEDGEIALQKAKELKPDILLVDICMPFLSGLDLVEKLETELPGCVVVVITGHDEFSYAQQAIRLRVFDYLLKPIVKDQLYEVMCKAREALTLSRSREKHIHWASDQLEKHMQYLKERFLNDWIAGLLSPAEVEEQLGFLDMKISPESGMILVKVCEKTGVEGYLQEWDRQLLLFAVQNIMEELLRPFAPYTVFRDAKENIVAVSSVQPLPAWSGIAEEIGVRVDACLDQCVLTLQQRFTCCYGGLPAAYGQLSNMLFREEARTPVVMLSKRFIDAHYGSEDLALQTVADKFNISPSYLSKLLRQELGYSFIDYLTQVRIRKAMQLMDDPFIKVYEVAQRVGYSSQHYFSTAFKKVTGVAPQEYRKGGART